MCGRFSLQAISQVLANRFHVDCDLNLKPRYNISPTQEIPIITSETPNKIILARWGLIPSWSKDGKPGFSMINAKAETINEKPAWKRPFETRRCLIPADGFYEWKALPTGKQPYRIILKDESIFAFAGLYDIWNSPDGNQTVSCTIITTVPNTLMQPIHDRMPAILSRTNEQDWLRTQPASTHLTLLKPYPAHEMHAYPISTLVNTPKNDTKEIIAPINS